jgi:FAD synthase
VIETFDRALRETPYDAWLGRIADRVELAGMLMTPESAFGYERRGTPETVTALGLDLGFDVVVVPQFTLDGEPVRSSDIRAAIAAGDFVDAERLLGRPYSVAGRLTDGVVAFDMPVALPPDGTYAARVGAPGGQASAALVTVDGSSVTVSGSSGFESGAPVRATFGDATS